MPGTVNLVKNPWLRRSQVPGETVQVPCPAQRGPWALTSGSKEMAKGQSHMQRSWSQVILMQWILALPQPGASVCVLCSSTDIQKRGRISCYPSEASVGKHSPAINICVEEATASSSYPIWSWSVNSCSWVRERRHGHSKDQGLGSMGNYCKGAGWASHEKWASEGWASTDSSGSQPF